MKTTTQKTGWLLAAMIGMAAPASAAVIYSETFDGLTAGSDTLADSSSDWTGTPDYPIVAATAPFTSNSMNISTAATNFNFANWSDGTNRTLLTVSFDIVDPGTMTVGDAGVRIATSRTTSNASLVDITNTLPDSTIVHYDIVSNISGAPVLYEDGVNSVAASSYDVWVDGVKVVDGAGLVGNGAGDIDGVGIWARRPDSNLLMDNVQFRDTAFVVPEPSIALLGSIGLLGLLRRRRV